MAGLTHHLRRAAVCVASGYGIKIQVRRGQLSVEDGVGRDRRSRTYSRATHGISRIVVVGTSGFITFEAIRWLHQLGIKLIHLDRDGRILATSAAKGGDVRLRRLQALAGGSETGIEIARMLLRAKLDGQAQTLELLNPDDSARCTLVRASAALAKANTLEQLLWAERDAALAYWSAWESTAVTFAPRDRRQVPDHWLRFGQRGSLLTGSPRLAINPTNAILNYLYAILEAETRLACLTIGLDPGLGIVHVDYRSRDSFALDLMEAARPAVDAYVLELLQERTFTRRDFAETPPRRLPNQPTTRPQPRRDGTPMGRSDRPRGRGRRARTGEHRRLADQTSLDAAHREQPVSPIREVTSPNRQIIPGVKAEAAHAAGLQALS
jgi:CRISPR-associated endonuclease Cas1